jgi:hypothetical protein
VIRVSPAEVEKGVALLGKTNLFDKAANTNILPDVLFCLLWQDRCRLAVNRSQQDDREEQANRVAGELRKLNYAGALKQAEDRRFFASMIATFGATFLLQEPMAPLVAENAATRWSPGVLTGNTQPRTQRDCHAFLMAAFEPGDTFDFSNPEDIAEFDRLYRRAK